jgi:peptidoglycan biosynthesis protein MviN/MurJ (putative lipid II flippase)
MLERRIGGLGLKPIFIAVFKMLAGCGAMVIVCWAIERIPGFPAGQGTLRSVGQLAILIIAGGAAYLGTCRVLGLDFQRL